MAERIIFDPSETVVSLADVRISRGWSRPSKACEHKSLVYSTRDRRIECKDCDQQIEGFDAFMSLCRHFEGMESAAKSREHKTKLALDAVVIRRAAKSLDKAWGQKMAPCCPRCDAGLLPEDFADGVRSAIGQEFEIARRRREANAPATPPQHRSTS